MSKLIIYLDQNFISDIAKLSLKNKQEEVKPMLKDIFDEIKSGVDEEKFLSPDSWVHAVETAAGNDSKLKDSIYSYQGYLGQVSLNEPWGIKDSQFVIALLNWCKIKPDKQDAWHLAFRENPNKRMENFKINVRMPNLGLGKIDSESIKELTNIRKSGISESDQYKKEIDANRQHYKHLLRTKFIVVLKQYNISTQQAEKFIDSQKFTRIPNIDIFCRLWSKSLANKDRKNNQIGHDYNDIEFLSVYLPYCDVVATDKYMKGLLQELKLDKKYDCRLYTMKNVDLRKMITFLKKERKKRQPANESLFSVLCVMLNDKPTYTIKFLQKLSQAQSKFQSTGKYRCEEIYTSVFLMYSRKEEIKLPDRKKIREFGTRAFDANQWAELLIFMNGFKEIYNTENKKIKELTSDLQAHLRGAATAIVVDEVEFNDDIFYIIETAIKNKINYIPKYKIPIIYA